MNAINEQYIVLDVVFKINSLGTKVSEFLEKKGLLTYLREKNVLGTTVDNFCRNYNLRL